MYTQTEVVVYARGRVKSPSQGRGAVRQDTGVASKPQTALTGARRVCSIDGDSWRGHVWQPWPTGGEAGEVQRTAHKKPFAVCAGFDDAQRCARLTTIEKGCNDDT